MTLRLTTLPLLFVVAGCAGGPRPNPRPRARPAGKDSPEAIAERHLETALARVKRRPRDRSAWRKLQRAASAAGQPHRYLLALEATEARGRLPSGLRQALAQGLRRRAASLAQLDAPSAALRALARADRLAPTPASGRARLDALRDRLILRQADRWLRADDVDKAREVYDALARRAVLDAQDLNWRRAAVGQTRALQAVATALRRLRDEAPGPAQRLARIYLKAKGRDPSTLVAALRAATLGNDATLVKRLDDQLSKVAPRRLLAAACRLRRRPTSPCCRQVQRWATTNRDALATWASLCRRLHWAPGPRAWLQRVILLLQTTGDLGLGPLEDLVSVSLARQTLQVSPHSRALARLAGRTSARRKTPSGASYHTPPTTTLLTPEQRAFEAWAAGRPRQAGRLLAQATARLTALGPSPAGPEARCRLVRLTRIVQQRPAALRLLRRLTRQDPRFRRHVLARLVAQGRPVAALIIARPGEEKPVVAWLHALGQTLHRWGMATDNALRHHWNRRYGAGPASRAWRHVAKGSRSAGKERISDLERVLRLAAQGHLAAARRAARDLARASGVRIRRRGALPPQFLIWWAWLAQAAGDKPAALRRLRRLRHQDPGGFRNLPAVADALRWLGHKRAAGRLADGLYERAPSDPALLRIVARGAITAGRIAKAHLAITDWASQEGRPDRVYQAAASWMARGGRHHRAAALASKALGWSGGRPLMPALATLRHQWAARRKAEARRTRAWLLARWPAGNGRDGMSRTLAHTMLAADRIDEARRLVVLHHGQDLRALLRKRRFAEVLKRARGGSVHEPLVARWPALAALAAQGQRQWRQAAQHVDRLARLAPEAEPVALALLQADQGQLRPALAMLALAHTMRPTARLRWLAAALAARAGKRPLAARLASRAILGGPSKASAPKGPDLARMTALAKGRLLPLEIPWAMVLATPADAGRCEP